MNKTVKTIISLVFSAAMFISSSASAMPLNLSTYSTPAFAAENAHTENMTASYKYRSQLDALSLKIYDTLEKMASDGEFAKGTARVELGVEQDVIKAYIDGDASLIQAFQNARDAFMYDRSDIFYVDWTKFTMRAGFDEDGKYYAFIGNGAYKDFYFDNGYRDESSVKDAVSRTEAKADEIIAKANEYNSDIEKIRYVHDTVINSSSYLEPGDFSTFHGANICGILLHNEAWCEGYSRTFQYIMQRMGFDCVLVIGGGIPNYAENGDTVFTPAVEEHMWNYVRLSNGKWYGIDVTYDDPTVITTEGKKQTLSDKFFMRGSDRFFADHIESGQFSQGGREFSYPVLSKGDYGHSDGAELTFRLSYQDYPDYDMSLTYMYPTFTDENGKELKGKEIVDAGYYIAGRDIYIDNDGNISKGAWTDWSRTGFDYGDESRLSGMAVSDTSKGITLIAYDFAVVKNAPDSGPTKWSGNMDIIAESESVYLRSVYVDKRASSIRTIYKDPASYVPIQDKCKKVTLRFDAPLKLADDSQPANISVSSDKYGAVFKTENFSWKNTELSDTGSFTEGSEITFDFYPDTSYNYSGTNYNFTVENLISAVDGTIPQAFSIQWAVPLKSVVPCVKMPSPSELTVPAVPRLLKNNFSADMFTDPVGNLIRASNTSLNISLIASKLSASDTEKIDSALGDESAFAHETFDLSISCSVMKTCLQYHQGKGTQVTLALPYPDGFDPRNMNGVSFEAYHFIKNADGSYTKEKLVCNATETGIFVAATGFSPFTVVAVPDEYHVSDKSKCLSVIYDEKTVSVSAVRSDGSSAEPELIQLSEGGSCTVRFVPKEGYFMERLVFNGENTDIPEFSDGAYSVTYSYDDIAENNSVTASLCADSVLKFEKNEGITALAPVKFNVYPDNGQPVFEQPEKTFENNIHTVEMGTAGTSVKGDLDNDGKITSADVLILRKIIFGEMKNTKNSDVTGDGKVNVMDMCMLKNMLIKTL